MTQEFPTTAVITAATGRLCCPMDDVYRILKFLVGEDVYTHQIPRVMREVEPWLKKRHEECRLAAENIPALEGLLRVMEPQQAIRQWIEKLGLPETLAVEPIPMDDHTSIDPVVEARAMNPNVIVVK
jgi:hypothetical protein